MDTSFKKCVHFEAFDYQVSNLTVRNSWQAIPYHFNIILWETEILKKLLQKFSG